MNRPTFCRTTGLRVGICTCYRCKPEPRQPDSPNALPDALTG